jgi:hypothetical protein
VSLMGAVANITIHSRSELKVLALLRRCGSLAPSNLYCNDVEKTNHSQLPQSMSYPNGKVLLNKKCRIPNKLLLILLSGISEDDTTTCRVAIVICLLYSCSSQCGPSTIMICLSSANNAVAHNNVEGILSHLKCSLLFLSPYI